MASRGFTLWLTGLPGAAKTTIAQITADELKRRGSKVETLDDEIIGANLSSSVGDTQDDAATLRRIGFVCELLARNEVIILVTVNSQGRRMVEGLRRNLQPLVEVEIEGPGQMAADGESRSAVDADDIDEQLPSPEIVVQADVATPEQCAAHILSKLEDLELIARLHPQNESYDAEDEEVIRRRLESLGYL